MKKYLISGATGFFGNYLVSELESSQWDSVGRHSSNTFLCDLGNNECRLELNSHYDYLIISSGHAHSFKNSKKENQIHFNVNLNGTKKLVEAVNPCFLKGIVYISTIGVYGDIKKFPFKENDELLGESAYAKSKIAAENYLVDWSKRSGIPVLILRVPLIAGKRPPGNLGAMIEAIRKRRYFSVCQGRARRSMVLAEDLAKFVIEKCGQHGIYNLTDGSHPSYREIEKCIAVQLNVPLPKELPLFLARFLAKIGDMLPILPINSPRLNKLIQDLIMDDTKARTELGWQPREVVKNFEIE